mmetsp:Transcript_14882/g.45465  ORF Transcript_14882/g.45465 Transcript_14882/m.45465 type:complete len:221 (+) Transcript_14882:139-801(+)
MGNRRSHPAKSRSLVGAWETFHLLPAVLPLAKGEQPLHEYRLPGRLTRSTHEVPAASIFCRFASPMMSSAASSTSSIVVCLPVERRSVPIAYSNGTPIARSTAETLASPEWHAAPADAATRSESLSSKADATTPRRPMERVLGSRSDGLAGPFIRTPGRPSAPPPPRPSVSSCASRLRVSSMCWAFCTSSSRAISHARPSAASRTTLSVPARRPLSWPPP